MFENGYMPYAFAALFAVFGIIQIAAKRPVGEWNYVKDFTDESIEKYARVTGVVHIIIGALMAVLRLALGSGSKTLSAVEILVPVAIAIVVLGICRKKILVRKN